MVRGLWVYRDGGHADADGRTPSCNAQVVERYQSMESMQMEPFHYGSHYSSAGVVLYYLIRLEPFTSLAILLQGGKFDHADRMFDSIAQTWQGCMKSTSDVKEVCVAAHCWRGVGVFTIEAMYASPGGGGGAEAPTKSGCLDSASHSGAPSSGSFVSRGEFSDVGGWVGWASKHVPLPLPQVHK